MHVHGSSDVQTQLPLEGLDRSGWVTSPWMGFDTETTGVFPARDRIVTAATVKRPDGIDFDEKSQEDESRSWLADPGVVIPARATEIHGITTEVARSKGRPAPEVIEEVNQALLEQLESGGAVVVFNASYDLPLLEAESRRHRIATWRERLGRKTPLILDPLVIDRAVNKYRGGKRTLVALVEVFGLRLGSAHNATVDAQMTLDVLRALLTQNPLLQAMTATDLMAFQREQHALWAEGFESYLAKRGRTAHISREWV